MNKFRRFIKDNRGKILCGISITSTLVGTGLAVKAGSDIKKEMDEKKPETFGGKAKIYAKHLWSVVLCDALSVASSVGCYKEGVRKEHIALELAAGYQAQLMAAMQQKLNDQKQAETPKTAYVDENGVEHVVDKPADNLGLDEEIWVIIPDAQGQKIRTTLRKLYKGNLATNKMLIDDGEIWFDNVLESIDAKPIGSTKFFSLDTCRDDIPLGVGEDAFSYMGNWVNFNLVLNMTTGEYYLYFNFDGHHPQSSDVFIESRSDF